MKDLESISDLTKLLWSVQRAKSVDLARERALQRTRVGAVLVLQAFHDNGSQAVPLELFNILVHREGVPDRY